eukprot:NODE_1956_length_2326_cov_7.311960.p1 GENE.NODE_1956_length_2326_cov_7.311960~~NODE_1956_length_2326_cov_7.311960.p1  ORF type:complete len:675 (+),score=65.87 NODE_1956_length_2326_cov_7.311960:287-2026(+)
MGGILARLSGITCTRAGPRAFSWLVFAVALCGEAVCTMVRLAPVASHARYATMVIAIQISGLAGCAFLAVGRCVGFGAGCVFLFGFSDAARHLSLAAHVVRLHSIAKLAMAAQEIQLAALHLAIAGLALLIFASHRCKPWKWKVPAMMGDDAKSQVSTLPYHALPGSPRMAAHTNVRDAKTKALDAKRNLIVMIIYIRTNFLDVLLVLLGRAIFAGVIGATGWLLVRDPSGKLSSKILPGIPEECRLAMGIVAMISSSGAVAAPVQWAICSSGGRVGGRGGGGRCPRFEVEQAWVLMFLPCIMAASGLQYMSSDRFEAHVQTELVALSIAFVGGMLSVLGYAPTKLLCPSRRLRFLGRSLFALPLAWLSWHIYVEIEHIYSAHELAHLGEFSGPVACFVGSVLLLVGRQVPTGAALVAIFVFHQATVHLARGLHYAGLNFPVAHALVMVEGKQVAMSTALVGFALALCGQARLHERSDSAGFVGRPTTPRITVCMDQEDSFVGDEAQGKLGILALAHVSNVGDVPGVQTHGAQIKSELATTASRSTQTDNIAGNNEADLKNAMEVRANERAGACRLCGR